MARKSKSSKNSNKSEASDQVKDVQEAADDVEASPESSASDEPVIIEGAAADVIPTEEISPEDDQSAEPASESEEPPAESADGASEETVEEEVMAEEVETSSDDELEEIEKPTPEPSEPEPEVVAAATPPAEQQKSSAVPMLLGGAAAAGLGYLAAIFSQSPADTTALTESITANGAQLETLVSDVAALQEAEVPTVDLSPIEGTLSDLATKFDGLSGDLGSLREDVSAAAERFDEATNALSDRITVLETAGPGESEAADATAEDLAAFRAELQRIAEEAEAQVTASMERASEIEQAALDSAAAAEEAAKQAEQEAAEAAALAERDAAIASVMTALESGQGFEEALAVLGDVPDALSANAESGVTTVIELQQTFADAARNALSEADTIPQDASAGDRLVAFFNQQTNARSLTPKEGDSTDAILSRGEAMMKQGDVAAALAELDALGDGPKAAMKDWLDQATTRQSVLDAAAQLTTTN